MEEELDTCRATCSHASNSNSSETRGTDRQIIELLKPASSSHAYMIMITRMMMPCLLVTINTILIETNDTHNELEKEERRT
jgi:hypothetical protein